MIQKSIRVRLYPTKEQEVLINKTIGCARFIYNYTLEVCKTYYEQTNHLTPKNKRFTDLVPLKDEYEFVRGAVAEQGYGLDVLIHDKTAWVRCAVARQGYGLDTLVCDENPWVRAAVAEQGYGLNFLIHDNSYIVRETAEATMKRKRRLSKHQK